MIYATIWTFVCAWSSFLLWERQPGYWSLHAQLLNERRCLWAAVLALFGWVVYLIILLYSA